ncbi:hypothetical protein TrVFT333_011881 [Trichoderma virens FT-333]|nr:hypothetical protein TrVFT333_011881 [Trichoderma virens FT-333]
MGLSRAWTALLLGIGVASRAAHAHDHNNSHIPKGATVSPDPLDGILWIHIFTQVLAYGATFPIGTILGMTKSKWHVPIQIFGSCLAILGNFRGHMHRGREFNDANIHASFTNILRILLLTQVTLGVYLKCHWERGINKSIRRIIRPIHSVNGICQGAHLSQFTTHLIMGNAYVAYAITLMAVSVVGQSWLRRSRRSLEFFECCVIAAAGCVQTFTQHRWDMVWTKTDCQYTVMGIVWWCAGLTGV